jgi:hypothetical protein
MNLVIIQREPVKTIATPKEQEEITHPFEYLRRNLADGGQPLTQDISSGTQCFLISTQNLLIALRQAWRIRDDTTIRVFSLASPKEQLLGTVTENNAGDLESYCLPASFPK